MGLPGLQGEDQRSSGNGQQKQAEDTVHPNPIIAGDGQVGRPGVDDGQGDDGVDGAVVLQHVGGLAVDGGRRGQQGRAADLAEGIALGDGDDDLDGITKQGVALGGVSLGDGIGVVFHALNRQLSALVVGDKDGGLGLAGNMVGHIV